MKTAMAVVCAIGLLVAVLGLADAIDRHGDAQADLAGALRESCIPKAGETAIIVSNGRTARCRILSTASTSTGMAPQVLSAAVIELMP